MRDVIVPMTGRVREVTKAGEVSGDVAVPLGFIDIGDIARANGIGVGRVNYSSTPLGWNVEAGAALVRIEGLEPGDEAATDALVDAVSALGMDVGQMRASVLAAGVEDGKRVDLDVTVEQLALLRARRVFRRNTGALTGEDPSPSTQDGDSGGGG